MKAFKKTTFLIIALLLVTALVIAGCGSKNNNSNSNNNSSSTTTTTGSNGSGNENAGNTETAGESNAAEKKYVIGYSQSRLNHPYRVAMVNGNQEYVEQNMPDVEFIVTDGQNDSNKQTSDVEALVARGVDVLLISPIASDALTPIVKEVMEKGVPVVTVDRKVNTPVTMHIGGDNYIIGAQAGKYIAEKLGGKGNIVEIQGTAGASVTVDRHQGFIDALKDYPDIKVIAEQHADFDRAAGLKFMEDVIQRFGAGEIDAVYAHNDSMGLGAMQALEEAGITGKILVSIDGENQTIDAIKEGRFTAVFIYPTAAPEAVQYAYKIAQGEAVPPEVTLPSQLVDATNVDEWIGKGI